MAKRVSSKWTNSIRLVVSQIHVICSVSFETQTKRERRYHHPKNARGGVVKITLLFKKTCIFRNKTTFDKLDEGLGNIVKGL